MQKINSFLFIRTINTAVCPNKRFTRWILRFFYKNFLVLNIFNFLIQNKYKIFNTNFLFGNIIVLKKKKVKMYE